MTSLEVFPSLQAISQSFKGILLDAYGVFWGGNDFGVLPGSAKAMEDLVSQGKIVGILSNSTQLALREIEKLKSHGLMQGRHFHFLITSGEIAHYLFRCEKLSFPTPRKTFWVLYGDHPKFSSYRSLFEGSPYKEVSHVEQADFIYISVPHLHGEDQTDVEAFRQSVADLVECGLPMVCANPDQFAHEGMPPKAVVRQGSIAKLYENMGGMVSYFGKPYSQAYMMALEEFNKWQRFDSADILMVGDTPETDIRGANEVGMASALVTKTGMAADRMAEKGVAYLRELPAANNPHYLIERLGNGL